MALWAAFVLVHAGVAAAGFLMPDEPMGDVYRVYEPWARQALAGGPIMGIDQPWVYPQLAIVPMVLAGLFAWMAGYTVGWAIVAVGCHAVAFALLIGRARSRGRRVAGWFWIGAVALLGPVALYRVDAITVALALAAVLWVRGRPALSSVLLTAATWIKVWPAAVLAAAVLAVRRRRAIVTAALAFSAVVVVVAVAAGGGGNLWGFLTLQTGRGLQLEAPVSTFYLWQAMLGVDGSSVYYDPDLLTFQVTGANVDVVIAAMTPLLLIVVAVVAGLGALAAARGARFAVLFPALSLALVTAFIALNKVGSPQYLTWIVVPLVAGLILDRRRWAGPALVGLAASAVTQAVYPLSYSALLQVEAVPVALLGVRNVLVVALCVWAIARVGALAARGGIHPARARLG